MAIATASILIILNSALQLGSDSRTLSVSVSITSERDFGGLDLLWINPLANAGAVPKGSAGRRQEQIVRRLPHSPINPATYA